MNTILYIIVPCYNEEEVIAGISQSRNRGHQNAVWAGMMEVKETADIVISIDCDGQDDIHTMEAMVDAYHDGCEVVYGVRSNRDTDTVTGWTSTVCIVCFMGGIQLICLGVLGEYIGKIYMEVKARPRYIISERTYQKPEKVKEDKTAPEEKGKV